LKGKRNIRTRIPKGTEEDIPVPPFKELIHASAGGFIVDMLHGRRRSHATPVASRYASECGWWRGGDLPKQKVCLAGGS